MCVEYKSPKCTCEVVSVTEINLVTDQSLDTRDHCHHYQQWQEEQAGLGLKETQ